MPLSIKEINEILALIDSWVREIEESQLSEQCRKSGRSFFDFMTSQGLHPGYLATLITNATGYNPRTLWTVQDAQLLREAIAKYEGAETLARQENEPGSAQKWTETMWGD